MTSYLTRTYYYCYSLGRLNLKLNVGTITYIVPTPYTCGHKSHITFIIYVFYFYNKHYDNLMAVAFQSYIQYIIVYL